MVGGRCTSEVELDDNKNILRERVATTVPVYSFYIDTAFDQLAAIHLRFSLWSTGRTVRHHVAVGINDREFAHTVGRMA